jgi:hypothetical protein
VHSNLAHIVDAILWSGGWVAAGIYFIVKRRIPWKGGQGAATGQDAVMGGVLITLIGLYGAYEILAR